MLVKGLDLIDSVDDFQLTKWHNEVYHNWKSDASQMAINAIDEIRQGYDFQAIIDDDTGELAAICSYSVENGRCREIPVEYTDYYNQYIELGWLAGNGKGGAREIIKSILQWSEIDKIPVVLHAASDARPFYEKMNFLESDRYKSYYYYIPDSILKEVE